MIAFLYGEIDQREARDFERHLRNCVECKLELGAFKQIRESVGAWRQEALGAATATSVFASLAVDRTSDLGKPSALAAIREFFGLSPLWYEGFDNLRLFLFCVTSVLALAHLLENPKLSSEMRTLYREGAAGEDSEDAVRFRLPDREAPEPFCS